MDELGGRIKILQGAKKVHVDSIAKIKREIAASRKKAKNEVKRLGGGRIKHVRRQVEVILKQYKIDRGARHGGDLVCIVEVHVGY